VEKIPSALQKALLQFFEVLAKNSETAAAE
jgi:hypothetical protein